MAPWRVLLLVICGLWPALGLAQSGAAEAELVTRAGMTLAPAAPGPGAGLAPMHSPAPMARPDWPLPALKWDDHPQGAEWSRAVMAALRGHGAVLTDVVPRDIASWCPAYEGADRAGRAAFWAGLISTLAYHESTHRPGAVGGGGLWYGLVQIAPGTAEWRKCEAETGADLLNGAANLRCGIRIMAATVPRDRVVAAGMRGVAADWGPFHSSAKREAMRDWVSRQSYCVASTRPVMRPETVAATGLLTQAGASLPDAPPVWSDARDTRAF